MNVPHGEVPDHLAAADLGLLLRAKSIASVVSSPIKFGEYLASGLPAVLNTGIGDCSELAAREGVGVALAHGSSAADIARGLERLVSDCLAGPDSMRERCRALAERELSWNAHLPRLSELYDRLSA
jgi:glycosyltransferase involved in cell wall biosynthesis